MRKIDSISLKRARETAERLIRGSRLALTLLGPVKKSDLKVSCASL
jgi:hypothetical protein